jgi:chemotaxis protein MotB
MKIIVPVVLIASAMMVSCGTSKKLDSANAQIAQLNGQVAQLNGKISENENQIGELQKANEINSRDAADCRAAKLELRMKKEKLDKELAARGTSLEQIEAKAETAVGKLRDAGCDVDYKNGRFLISVPDEFTFKKGSAIVGPKAREALNIVAEVLRDNPGVTATVVGNTDTLPVRGVADNWSLSTERANSVVRVLENAYNINPKRLTAAGRSKFRPVASNDTPEGQAKNRRIEIIINPRMDRIWDLIAD